MTWPPMIRPANETQGNFSPQCLFHLGRVYFTPHKSKCTALSPPESQNILMTSQCSGNVWTPENVGQLGPTWYSWGLAWPRDVYFSKLWDPVFWIVIDKVMLLFSPFYWAYPKTWLVGFKELIKDLYRRMIPKLLFILWWLQFHRSNNLFNKPLINLCWTELWKIRQQNGFKLNQRNIGNDFVCVPIMVVLKDRVWKNKCYESQIWLKCNLLING